jgi:hypothetical protein
MTRNYAENKPGLRESIFIDKPIYGVQIWKCKAGNYSEI